MFDRETLELIQSTAQKAQTASMLKLPGDGRKAIVQIGGELREFDFPPDCRAHVVDTLEDLIAFATREDSAQGAMVWYGVSAVVLILDDSDRRDRVTLPLEFSREFAALAKLEKEPVLFDQRGFVRFLRVTMGAAEPVIAPWRRLDWKTTIDAAGEASHVKDRLGREVTAQVQGTAALPDSILFSVPVYRTPGERQTHEVKCFVELDCANARIGLVPAPSELDLIQERALADIRRRLDEGLNDTPVYRGRP